MVKSEEDVVKEFNGESVPASRRPQLMLEIVNMTADVSCGRGRGNVDSNKQELEAFLKTGDSESTGWSKDDGSGESVGHESGRKIVKILQGNPDKVSGQARGRELAAKVQDPSKYSDEDKEHMRKVVAYCKRHLAQEEHLKDSKTPEELEQAKSTRSLKNWVRTY